ncbi:elongation factor P [Bifidobacterium lemurum]|uniref:Elongation factor P n=1 Tax=Bifidobacterium lemurum TaxID=1603886 RepID=A0A261FTI9_9BIFI|nr:elongation factor P [Bifidobacterium lemurum]
MTQVAQTTNDIKNGSVLNLDGQLWAVTKFQHVKPGKGPAFVRTTLKNVLSGKIVDKTFNAGMKIDFETVDNRTLQYSYEDGDNFVFMDMTTYDQVMVPKTLVGDQSKFLLEGTDCIVSFNNDVPLSVELPGSVVLTITHTEPGLQGNRSNAGTKPATVETGAEIQVPLFINEGDRVKVNTTDGSYTGRENG